MEKEEISSKKSTTEHEENTNPHSKDVKIRKIECPDDEDFCHISSEYDTLVLSGGAIKGFLILGALQYAHDNYHLKNVTTFVGTSVGAMICYLVAIGYTPIEILVYICTHDVFEDLKKINVANMMEGFGASSFHPIHDTLEKMTIEKIGKLPTLGYVRRNFGKTLVFTTYNLTKKTTEYLSPETHPDLPCLVALRMTSNLPLFFEHFKYDGCYYIDGGICDNFAVQQAEKRGKKVLGILNGMKSENTAEDIRSSGIVDYIHHLMFIPISQATELRLSLATEKSTIVRLSYESVKFFNFDIPPSTRMDMFSSGYQRAKSCLENLPAFAAPI